MGRDVYVSATLAGRHSLGPDAVAKACGEVERELRDGTAEYTLQSFVPGHELTRHGGRGGSGMVGVRIHASSFMVFWNDESSFEAPAATLDGVCGCLGVTGEVHVRVHALMTDVSMEPLKIAGGSLEATFDSAAFRLKPGAMEGRDEIALDGLVATGKNAAANIVIFAALKSGLPGVNGMLGRALGTLSAHCGALAR
ncbi:MAG: hypothetical protein OXU25_02090 [Thaumarchaeota archaeon]|nr:hypothetical protein [Nitrososphaerota archaeon]